MFYDIFSALCAERGMSKNRAAKEIGLSNSTVTKWKKTSATPDSATLAKISKFFGVSMDFLLEIPPESSVMKKANPIMLNFYRIYGTKNGYCCK